MAERPGDTRGRRARHRPAGQLRGRAGLGTPPPHRPHAGVVRRPAGGRRAPRHGPLRLVRNERHAHREGLQGVGRGAHHRDHTDRGLPGPIRGPRHTRPRLPGPRRHPRPPRRRRTRPRRPGHGPRLLRSRRLRLRLPWQRTHLRSGGQRLGRHGDHHRRRLGSHRREVAGLRLRRPGIPGSRLHFRDRPVRRTAHRHGAGGGRTRSNQREAPGMTETTRPKRGVRAGGRAARVAARAAGLPEDERAVRPGQSGGAYKPLTESECRSVYDTALTLLSEFGMGTPIPEFIEVVVPAGGWVDEHERLHFPRSLVEDAVDMAAKSFTWHGFDDNRSIDVGGDRVHFGTAGAAVSVWDHETRKHRPSDLQDVYGRGPPRRHARTRPLPRPDARGPRHGRGPGPRPEHRLRGGHGHLQADGHVVLPARTRRRGRRHVRPDAGREAGLVRRAALLRGQQHLRRTAPALRRGRRAFHGRPGALRHAHQPALGGAGRCHVACRSGRVPGPGPRRVPVRPYLRQPPEARPPVRHGTLAVRLRPADRRHDRRLRRGGRDDGCRRPGGQLAGPAVRRRRRYGRLQGPRQPGRPREGPHRGPRRKRRSQPRLRGGRDAGQPAGLLVRGPRDRQRPAGRRQPDRAGHRGHTRHPLDRDDQVGHLRRRPLPRPGPDALDDAERVHLSGGRRQGEPRRLVRRRGHDGRGTGPGHRLGDPFKPLPGARVARRRRRGAQALRHPTAHRVAHQLVTLVVGPGRLSGATDLTTTRSPVAGSSAVDAPSSLELIGRLALALALGAVLGLERETRHKTAGLRTHSLVALGAALFTIAGAYAVIGPQNDPSRVAAQVVTGIGFIGAGAMIRSGFTVTGITTAATLWMAAAFGIAAAMGLYVVSIVAGAMALVVVVTFGPLKPYVLFRRSRRRFEVRYRPGHGTLDALLMGLESGGGRIMGVLTTESDDPSQGLRQTTIDVRGMADVELAKVLATIADRDEVVEIDHAPGNGS